MYAPNDPKRKRLVNQIQDWNMNRLDLFEISEPNEYLEYYGVMRFFFQGEDMKYQSKCLRVCSTATTRDLIDALVLKFHPDMRMLSNERYSLYECHNLQERKLKENEHPLIVQLNWATDDRDGKFILKNESRRRRSTDMSNHALLSNYGMSKSTSALTNGYDKHALRSQSSVAYTTGQETKDSGPVSNFMRRLSASTKKGRKKTASTSSAKSGRGASISGGDQMLLGDYDTNAQRIADEISGKPPDSSFTRTISNPDEVMKRRRQKKLESRLEQFSGVKGNDETGGTLKIYGESINPDIPYKTLLLSVNDTADKVLAETLDKYGLGLEDQRLYVLVQQNIPPKDSRNRHEIPQEIILHDQDCPLGILVNCPPKRGYATFAIRRRGPTDLYPNEPRVPPINPRGPNSPSSVKSPSVHSKVVPHKRQQPPQTKDEEDDDATSQNSTATTDNNLHSPSNNCPTYQEYPRLVMCVADEDGNMYENENETYSLAELTKTITENRQSNQSVKFIKIGSQQSSIGGPPNILLSQEYYPDIRPTHCHLSAKKESTNGGGVVKLYLLPTLDSSAKSPKPCIVYVNQVQIEKSTRLQHEDYIQLGDYVMFKYEEIENEDNIVGSTSSNVLLDQMREHGSIDKMQLEYLTADLPISLQYDYKSIDRIINRIMSESKKFVERYCRELFAISNDVNDLDLDLAFRLHTAYSFYLVIRASLADEKHANATIEKIAKNINDVIHDDKDDVEKQVYWLSNASELLHLIQCDNDLRNHCFQAQDVLINAVEQSFSFVQNQFCKDLLYLLPYFLQENDADIEDDVNDDNSPCVDRASVLVPDDIVCPIQHLLQTLSLAHNLFVNCQLNVALSIQMFSQLFHLINSWMFNSVIGGSDLTNSELDNTVIVPITRDWGERLSRRLNRIRSWSMMNGLEMAANCHMEKMYQVAELLAADKSNLKSFSEKCMDLMNINSNQLGHLLENCEDCQLPANWIGVIVSSAQQLHDKAFQKEDRSAHPPLYEDLDLRLPLLLPADGYSCDRNIVCSTPNRLVQLLDMLHSRYHVATRVNPPTTHCQTGDTRWRAYLGNYENTPSVSRSGTIIDQVSAPISPRRNGQVNSQPQMKLPRNHIQNNSSKNKDNQLYINSTSENTDDDDAVDNFNNLISDNEDDEDEPTLVKNKTNNFYEVKLKKINNSLGLSIIAAKARPRDPYKIYVREVIANGAGDKCGKIRPGDQLVRVDDQDLLDINQEGAVALMKKTKSTVKLVMERDAARHNGVEDIVLNAANKTLNKQNPNKTSKLSPKVSNKMSKEPLAKKGSNRSNYTLPPLPTNEKVISSKQPQTKQTTAPTRKPAPTKSVAVSTPEYNSLPIRKPKKPQEDTTQTTKYVTVNPRHSLNPSKSSGVSQPKTGNVQPKPRQHSSSQPDLTKVVKLESHPPPRARTASSDSDSSSSSGSYTTDSDSDSAPSQTNKPQVPPKQVPTIAKPLSKPPQRPPVPHSNKAVNNVRPVTSSVPVTSLDSPPVIEQEDNRNPPRPGKGKFLSRPEIAQNSDDENYSPEVPARNSVSSRPKSAKPKKPPSPPSSSSSDSATSTSEYSESEPSTSSPKPAAKSSQSVPPKSVPSKSLPPQSLPTQITKPPRQLPLEPQNIDIQSALNNSSSPSLSPVPSPIPQKSTSPSKEHFSPYNPSKNIDVEPSIIYPSQNYTTPLPVITPTKSPLNLINSVPPPKPTALHPQYHPPSQLEENNLDYSTPSYSMPSIDSIQLRRKTVEDQIRQDIGNKFPSEPLLTSPTQAQSQRKIETDMNPTIQNPSKTLYGRPTFNPETPNSDKRPVSMYKPPAVIPHSGNLPNSESYPPSLPRTGIIVPATPPGNVIGNQEVYKESHIKKPEPKSIDESVESLSFRDKMKLFAQKNGEEDVAPKTRFSSKQRRIESGIYN